MAGVVSAGAEIVEGLSAKDVTDCGFDLFSFGVDMAGDPSLGSRVLERGTEARNPEALEKLPEPRRRELEAMVESFGFSLEELRQLFLSGCMKNRCDMGGGAAGDTRVVVEEVNAGDVVEGDGDASGSGAEDEAEQGAEVSHAEKRKR